MKIAVTGAAGFIGSCLVGKFSSIGFNDLILVTNLAIAKN
jgi:nucleoside-diphosphate-sugar epimerase